MNFQLHLNDMVAPGSRQGLNQLTKGLGLDDRSWNILWHRLGPGSKKTLEGTGEIYAVTRERIRQIQSAASRKISSNVDEIESALNVLEEATPQETFSHDELGLQKAYSWVERQLESASISADPEDVQRLITAIRAAPDRCGAKWPRFTFLACFLYPPMKAYAPVGQKWREIKAAEKERARRWTYPELIEYVLERESEPLHWREVVEKARALRRRRSVHPGSVMNTMIASPDFVRVAPGTYALKRQGYTAAEPLVDRIWKTIQVLGRPPSLEEITYELKKGGEFNPKSVSMHLNLHTRFYKSVDGRYGLRILLPPPEEQTLRTPRHLIEDADSYKRLARASTHGYNVEDILDGDRETLAALQGYASEIE